MAIFSRRNEVVEEVPELEHYYAERRTSNIWGWVSAIVVMALTVLIIFGLFYGGRWVYRQINETPVSQPTVTAPANPPAEQRAENSGVTALPSDEPSNASSPSGTQPAASTPVAPGNNVAAGGASQIPNSGPGDVFAVTLLAIFVGYLFKVKSFTRKTNG